jgi:hypothetical protein
MDPTSIDWTARLLEQLTLHWEVQARPRLEGLTDEEYLWEPVDGMWSVRPRDAATTAMAAGSGDLVIDFEFPQPDPPPVTTIAWRLGHLIVGVFGARNAAHFGGPPRDYFSQVWPAHATDALAALDEEYGRWVRGVRGLGPTELATPVGEAEGEHAAAPFADLVLHIHREAIHHLAEVAVLRDLFTWRRSLGTT